MAPLRKAAAPRGESRDMNALAKTALIATVAGLLGACAGINDHRGAVIDPELTTAVQVGVDNKDSVAKTLGRPSFTGQFADNDWYYVSRDTKSVAFSHPRVLDQTVLHIKFDAAGNVASVQRTGRELIASVNPAKGRTPTLGRKHSFFQELFGNIGTVTSGGLPGSGGAPQQ
jgi:outer membrane protein assembly factor BamE (lipoprotein component of BamABCDE complex)